MFAFGSNQIGAHACPVTSAGHEVEGDYLQMAEQFDHNCSEMLDGLAEGIIEEQRAKQAWRDVIESWQEMADEARSEDEEMYAKRVERKARSIYQDVFQ